MEIYESTSPEETAEIAAGFAERLGPGSVVALVGGLGAGKTAFVKGIAARFGRGAVTSPTYTLVNHYDGDPPVYHFDVYRIEEADEDTREWMDEYLFGGGICVIEWADNIKEILPDDAIRVEIVKDPARGDGFREIRIC